jgi:hypothetical protein
LVSFHYVHTNRVPLKIFPLPDEIAKYRRLRRTARREAYPLPRA